MGLQVSQGPPIERAGYMYLTSIQRAWKHEPFCIDATSSPLMPIASSTLGMAVRNYTGCFALSAYIVKAALEVVSSPGTSTTKSMPCCESMVSLNAARPMSLPRFWRPSSQIKSTSKGHDACLPCLAARNNSTALLFRALLAAVHYWLSKARQTQAEVK